MSPLVQDVAVTLVALAAAFIVIRRVFGVVVTRASARKSKPTPGCDHCDR